MSYKAIVCRLRNVREHPNADRLKLATVMGQQVIVGLEARDEDLGVFFPADGQLSDEFCKENDLYPRFKEIGGVRKKVGGGFIDPKNRRIRAQSLRGEKSYGFWVPLSYFSYIKNHTEILSEGQDFTEINGYKICNKYETGATKKAKQNTQRKTNRRATLMFHRHFDTAQYQYYKQEIPVGATITLLEKLHGTSGRFGLVAEQINLTRFQKLLKAFGLIPNTEFHTWKYLNGSRNVILEQSDGVGYYGTNDFRYSAVSGVSLSKGETLFFELVGYVNGSQLIMPKVSTKQLGPDFVERWGEYITYKYGCDIGQCKLFVYRITQTSLEGRSVDLSWPALKKRCSELGLDHVPEMAPPFIYDGNLEHLDWMIEELTFGPSFLDPSHIREGVAVRVDYDSPICKIYKNKSHEFYTLEGVVKDRGSVDIEEAS